MRKQQSGRRWPAGNDRAHSRQIGKKRAELTIQRRKGALRGGQRDKYLAEREAGCRGG